MPASDEALPWLKVFPADWLADTTGMSLAAQGAHFRLLTLSWLRGSLPNDAQQLRRLAGADPDEWVAIWREIAPHWSTRDDSLVHPKLEEQRAEARRRRERAAEGAALTNAKRWGSHSDSHTDSHSDSHGVSQSGRLKVAISALSSQGSDSEASEPASAPEREGAARRRVVREEPVEFIEIKRLYPKRGGGNPWPPALKQCLARLAEGATWRELIDGTRRYAEYCQVTGRIRTETVMQAKRFFGEDRGYTEEWERPAPVRSLKQQAADDAIDRFLGATDPPTEDEIRAAREEAIRANERTVQRAGMAGRNGVTIDAGAAAATVVDRLRPSQ